MMNVFWILVCILFALVVVALAEEANQKEKRNRKDQP